MLLSFYTSKLNYKIIFGKFCVLHYLIDYLTNLPSLFILLPFCVGRLSFVLSLYESREYVLVLPYMAPIHDKIIGCPFISCLSQLFSLFPVLYYGIIYVYSRSFVSLVSLRSRRGASREYQRRGRISRELDNDCRVVSGSYDAAGRWVM